MQFDAHLPPGWRWQTIESVQSSEPRPVVTGPFGSSIGSKFFVDTGVPVIRGNNLSMDRRKFIDDGFVFLTEEKAAEFRNLEARPGDLVFTAAGTIGQVGLIPRHPRFPRYIISNKQMRARLNTSVVEPLFAYYWFTEPYVRDYIRSRNTGSTIPLINLSVLRGLPLPVPPLDIQRAILGVVSTLDDRIDLLRQTNTTLESIAQALFKSWFIDFDPVRAKQAGREPEGMDAPTAALFPAEFEESALGQIPKGWQVVPLNQEGLVQIGGVWGEESRTDKCSEPVSCLRGIDAVDIGLGNVPAPPTRWVSAKQIGSRRLLEGDILIEGSGSFCGRSLYWSGQYEQLLPFSATYSNFVKRVSSPRGPHVSRWVQRHLGNIYQSGEVKNYRTGSAFPNLDLAGMLSVERTLPPDGLLERFHEVMQTFETAKSSRIRQVDTLMMLRDTLLPRLISGKLRLPEAQEQLEEALA